MNASRHPAVGSERRSREFASPAFEAWLGRLCTQGLCPILVGLILKLERLARVPLGGPRRVEILRAVMTMIRDIADDLPTPAAARRGAQGPAAAPLPLVQRLWALTFKNLKRALHDLDRGGGGLGDHDQERAWVVGEMYLCLGRQIELGARWGQTWPRHTWQELHDLFSYSTNRMDMGRGGADEAVSRGPTGSQSVAAAAEDPQTMYKRLLMIGLCAEQGAHALLVPTAEGSFSTWVQVAELHDPVGYCGVLGTYLVEASSDAPARLVPGALGPVSRAKVLRLPPGFLAALAAARAGPHPRGAG
ncbi:hypothetical protein [Candidatus Thiodictyon syntrophicum]|jgi:hypothetical protein|uniref:Uncharacterized protein n=1 Tax=Candidatus Thiodictyon syntrophicum TaxID=1166950 RepID=A0A2K8U5U2_9GAMM|nr:hypothetical protein [Candidatus Thiodictyon syntrophicum]AUB80943.1 hypothetical protein THSYN_08280 [Candidatus Thiodictyon syntrophicum]